MHALNESMESFYKRVVAFRGYNVVTLFCREFNNAVFSGLCSWGSGTAV